MLVLKHRQDKRKQNPERNKGECVLTAHFTWRSLFLNMVSHAQERIAVKYMSQCSGRESEFESKM